MFGLIRKPAKALALAARIAGSATQRRHFWRWVRSGKPGYLMQAQMPWITYEAIDFLTA